MMTLLIQCRIARRVLQEAITNFAGPAYRDKILRRLRGFIRGTAKFKVGFLHRDVLQFIGKRGPSMLFRSARLICPPLSQSPKRMIEFIFIWEVVN